MAITSSHQPPTYPSKSRQRTALISSQIDDRTKLKVRGTSIAIQRRCHRVEPPYPGVSFRYVTSPISHHQNRRTVSVDKFDFSARESFMIVGSSGAVTQTRIPESQESRQQERKPSSVCMSSEVLSSVDKRGSGPRSLVKLIHTMSS